VIARMMAKQPGERFASYDELIAELDRVSAARTRPAGFFVRSVAAAIDFSVVGFSMLLPSGVLAPFGKVVENLWLTFVGALYGIVALSRWGRTIGHWLLDLEVVAMPNRDRPSLGAAALRHFTTYGGISLAMLLGVLRDYVPSGFLEGLTVVVGAIGVGWPLIDLAYVSLQTPDKRAAWDRAAKTMIRYRTRSLAA
jgi:uncharacterized RDD family membrane protein YckC